MENILPDGIKLTPSMKEILKMHQIKLKNLDKSDTMYLHEQISIYRSMLMLQNEELISAQKVIKREMKKSGDLFASFPMPLFTFDGGLEITSGNRAFYDFIKIPVLMNGCRNLSIFADSDTLSIIKHMTEFDTEDECPAVFINGDNERIRTGIRLRRYGDGFIAVINTAPSDSFSSPDINLFRLADSGRMLNAIAHQWKQPLNSLSLLLELIAEDSENEETLSFKNASSEIIKYMADTVKDFLTYSKSSETETVFDIKDSLGFVFGIMKPRLLSENISLTAICGCGKSIINLKPDSRVTCYAHRMLLKGNMSALQQVLINLTTNAADALENAEEKSITIRINTDAEALTLSVEDTGCGLDADTAEKLFEPGFSTKKHKNGTGIGLNISKHIIESHFKGSITAGNTEKGAKFTLLMPIYSESLTEPEKL